jgi:hypothetical protein
VVSADTAIVHAGTLDITVTVDVTIVVDATVPSCLIKPSITHAAEAVPLAAFCLATTVP